MQKDQGVAQGNCEGDAGKSDHSVLIKRQRAEHASCDGFDENNGGGLNRKSCGHWHLVWQVVFKAKSAERHSLVFRLCSNHELWSVLFTPCNYNQTNLGNCGF